jgi:hypothetical protein
MGEGEGRRLEVNWAQTVAAPLAAVTSAVLLSTVGVAGTVIGAALGALAYSLGTAIYTHYIGATKDRVANAQKAAAAKIGRAQSRVQEASENLEAGSPDADEELAKAGEDLHQARSALADAEEDVEPVGWRGVFAGLPWKRIALATAGVFLAAMALIVSFELVTGRAVSSYTGGSDSSRRTSLPGFLGGGGGTDETPAPGETATDGPTPAGDATDSGTTDSTASAQPSRAPASAEETTAPQDATTTSTPTESSTTTAPTPLATEPTVESSPTP